MMSAEQGGRTVDEQLEAVQRMQDYIRGHLYGEITLADLARVSLYSPWYAHRLFQRWTGLTPSRYIRRLRLSESALRLRDRGGRIADAAFEMGFGSVDGYQRAFMREFGVNPGEYALHPSPIYLFTPYGVSYAAPEKRQDVEQVKTVFVQVVERPARKAIIKRGERAEDYFTYCGEVGCDVWGLLKSISSIVGEPVAFWLPKAMILPGTSTYVQGVEVETDYAGTAPEGFDLIELDACKYLMFTGEPFDEKDYAQAIEQVWDAMGKYDPAALGYRWDDENPRIQLEPIGTRGYIELRAVR